jgi:hypothetical protein
VLYLEMLIAVVMRIYLYTVQSRVGHSDDVVGHLRSVGTIIARWH